MSSARAWAVKARGVIDVRTVQDSRIGAMVNWLLVGAQVTVMDGISDRAVEAAFRQYAPKREAKLVAVMVEELQ
jgi:hypothetical protein